MADSERVAERDGTLSRRVASRRCATHPGESSRNSFAIGRSRTPAGAAPNQTRQLVLKTVTPAAASDGAVWMSVSAVVAALELVGQALVIDAELMEQRRVEIVHADRILGDVVTEIVRGAVGDAGLDAAARHPDGEAARMVVAAVVAGGEHRPGSRRCGRTRRPRRPACRRAGRAA